MILDIPPTTANLIVSVAQKKGVTVDELLLQTFADDDEAAYYDWFYKHHFDVEKLSQAIGEYDENGCAKNTLTLPQGLNRQQLRAWLSENIPKHLKNQAMERSQTILCPVTRQVSSRCYTNDRFTTDYG